MNLPTPPTLDELFEIAQAREQVPNPEVRYVLGAFPPLLKVHHTHYEILMLD